MVTQFTKVNSQQGGDNHQKNKILIYNKCNFFHLSNNQPNTLQPKVGKVEITTETIKSYNTINERGRKQTSCVKYHYQLKIIAIILE